LGDELRGQVFEHGVRHRAGALIARAVDPFEAIEKKQHLFEVLHAQPVVHAKERVRDRVENVLVVKQLPEVVNILAGLLKVAEPFFRDADDQTVDLTAVLGKIGRHLGGKKGAGILGDLQRAPDAVVVRDGDEIHARVAAGLVDLRRAHVTFRRADPAQKPFARPIGIPAVNVKVGSGLTGRTHSVRSLS
jgi:hypothetical protein